MQIGFNPAQYQPYTGPELMDAGDVPVVIEDLVAERAKDPASGLLKVTAVVQQGHRYAGRKIFYRLNLWNVSETSKTTAHKQMTSLCYACGIMGELADTDLLKGRQCIFELTNDGNYNNVKLVKDMAGNVPGKAPVNAGQPGGPQFGSAPAPGATFAGMPQGAAPGGFNPGAQPGGAPPNPFAQGGAPAGFPGGPPPQQQQQQYQQQPQQQADPYAGWVRQNGYRQNPQTMQWEPDAPPQHFQQPNAGAPPPFGGAPAGYVQPQAPGAAPGGFNPGFQPGAAPGGQQSAPPAGWPQ